MAAFAVATPGHAQERELPEWARPERPVARHAFVLAIPDYDSLKDVPTAENDGRAMKTTLARLDFAVTRPEGSLTRDAILDRIDAFAAQVNPGDTVLFYYSGHGFERYGRNYIVPRELTEIPDNRAGIVAISLDYVMRTLEARSPGLTLYMLDACRSDAVPPAATPFKQSGNPAIAGFGPMKADIDTTIVYAAGPRAVSYGLRDGDPPGSASLFTREVAGGLMRGNTQFYAVWRDISDAVFHTSGQRQKPWLSDNGSAALGLVFHQNAAYRARHDREWAAAALAPGDDQPGELKTFLAEHPDSRFAAAARARLLGGDAGGGL